MVDFLLVLGDFLRYRKRWMILFPTLLALPFGYALASQFLTPEIAGQASFQKDYSSFFQTAAAVIASLLVVIAVESRLASTQTRLATREAGVLAVIWIGLAEVAALAALSPGLSPGLDGPSFNLTVSGGASGLIAVVLIAARRG